MQSINLEDELYFKKNNKKKIRIITNCKNLRVDKSNLIYKGIYEILNAKKKIDREFDINIGLTIYLTKRIPMEAGLGGGSANCATAMKGVNELYNLGFTIKELIEIGKNIGGDVPFCLVEGTCLVKGKGEKILSIKNKKTINILLVKPKEGLSTKEVFSQYRYKKSEEKKDEMKITKIVKGLETGDIENIGKNLYNDLENIAIKKLPQIGQIIKELKKTKSLGVLMSGSGSTIFAIYNNEVEVVKAKNYVDEIFKNRINSYTVKTTN